MKKILLVIIISLVIKLGLFGYAAINVPSLKFMPDTRSYLEPGINLVEKGVFATFDKAGNINYEVIRTPGYPIFLAFLNKSFAFSFDMIVVVQILLITFAGYLVYKAAYRLDKNIALLAAIIFLFDQPTTIASLMLLAEALYAVTIAVFIYFFLAYLKEHKISLLIFSALALVIATFIRPISYYLGVCLACGVFYVLFRKNIKKAVAHILILLLVFHVPLGLWQYRNYLRTGNADFSTIDDIDATHMGLTHRYRRDGGLEKTKMSPPMYYANRTSRCIIAFFTLPGTFKYFKSPPLKLFSRIYGWPWMIFCFIGFLSARYNKLEQQFLLLTILYMMLVSVIVVGLCMGSRFRVQAMPLISILSATGWVRITGAFKRWKEKRL